MPVYNARRYLAEAVRSVLGQTLTDFELILVDDGSTDGSARVIDAFARADDRVRLVRRPNAGVTRSLNEGIALSRGRYVARMDADDRCLPFRLARQVEYLDAHPECVAVGSRVVLMDPHGSPLGRSGHATDHESIDRKLLTHSGWAMVHPTVMMRRQAVVDLGGYDERWVACEDHDLFLRLAERGRLANLAQPLLWYRRHYQSVNFVKHASQTKLKRELLQAAHARRGLPFPADWQLVDWTPPPERQQLVDWSWCAAKSGNYGIAARHAVAALRLAPTWPVAWKLLACLARDRVRLALAPERAGDPEMSVAAAACDVAEPSW